jgi:hypothetical protein
MALTSIETGIELAKEKGFDEPCYRTYNHRKVLSPFPITESMGGEKIDQNLIVAIDKFKNQKGDKNIFGIADRFQLVEDIKNDTELEN